MIKVVSVIIPIALDLFVSLFTLCVNFPNFSRTRQSKKSKTPSLFLKKSKTISLSPLSPLSLSISLSLSLSLSLSPYSLVGVFACRGLFFLLGEQVGNRPCGNNCFCTNGSGTRRGGIIRGAFGRQSENRSPKEYPEIIIPRAQL